MELVFHSFRNQLRSCPRHMRLRSRGRHGDSKWMAKWSLAHKPWYRNLGVAEVKKPCRPAAEVKSPLPPR
jgi:hypothetical protein